MLLSIIIKIRNIFRINRGRLKDNRFYIKFFKCYSFRKWDVGYEQESEDFFYLKAFLIFQ